MQRKKLILNNTKGIKTKELLKKAGCNLLYLPPYSPDFNPIENQWATPHSTLKSRYKTFKQRGYEHGNAIDVKHLEKFTFYTDNWDVFAQILPKNCYVISKAHINKNSEYHNQRW